MKKLILMLLVVGTLMVQGCGTIMNGTMQTIPVTSSPPGAEVTTSTGLTIQTPGEIPLKRGMGRKVTVTIKHSAYYPQTVTLKSSISGWAFGNFLIGGIIGGVIDQVSGGGYKYTPKALHFKLNPVNKFTKTKYLIIGEKIVPTNE